jgi:hypothetical protein
MHLLSSGASTAEADRARIFSHCSAVGSMTYETAGQRVVGVIRSLHVKFEHPVDAWVLHETVVERSDVRDYDTYVLLYRFKDTMVEMQYQTFHDASASEFMNLAAIAFGFRAAGKVA